jgi:Mg-chelatase subunit ChlD
MTAEHGKSKGIEITRQQSSSGVTLTGGKIKIDASAKAIETHFIDNWGKVYITLDCSGSMAGYKLEQAKRGILEFAKDAIGKEYVTGLIKFDSSATHLCEPTKDVAFLEISLREIDASGTTNMVDAIKVAYARLKNLECSRVIVIATDGQPDNQEETLKLGKLVKNAGIEIITIGTDDADQQFLKRLASREDLGQKVSSEMFAKTISSAYKLLPSPKAVTTKK